LVEEFFETALLDVSFLLGDFAVAALLAVDLPTDDFVVLDDVLLTGALA
jgi:hypothetical protein